MKKLMATLILSGLATSVSAAGIHIEDGWRIHENPKR